MALMDFLSDTLTWMGQHKVASLTLSCLCAGSLIAAYWPVLRINSLSSKTKRSDTEHPQRLDWKCVLAMLVGLPMLAWFPVAFAGVFVSAWLLIFGFDDMPIICTFFSLALGTFISIAVLIICLVSAWKDDFNLAKRLLFAITAFGVVALPLARTLTYLEESKRYGRYYK